VGYICAVVEPLVGFKLDGRRWALALGAAERAVPMVAIAPLPDAPEGVQGAINVHGEIVPVLDLRGRLGLAPREPDPGDQLLLVRASRLVALPVDEVDGVLELATDAGELLPRAGVAVLPDGLVTVYDLESLLSDEEEARLAAALAEATS
jgi:purine-binding chemotaxis protein CheW